VTDGGKECEGRQDNLRWRLGVPGEPERERWGQGGLGIKKGKARGGSECQWKMGSVCELGTVTYERDYF
jgi:hypothetical protein